VAREGKSFFLRGFAIPAHDGPDRRKVHGAGPFDARVGAGRQCSAIENTERSNVLARGCKVLLSRREVSHFFRGKNAGGGASLSQAVEEGHIEIRMHAAMNVRRGDGAPWRIVELGINKQSVTGSGGGQLVAAVVVLPQKRRANPQLIGDSGGRQALRVWTG